MIKNGGESQRPVLKLKTKEQSSGNGMGLRADWDMTAEEFPCWWRWDGWRVDDMERAGVGIRQRTMAPDFNHCRRNLFRASIPLILD